MSKSRPPEPDTLEAILPSFGYGPGTPRWTRHKFVGAVECHLPNDGECWELLYQCQETGVKRRWGTWFDNEEEEAN